MQQHGLFRVKQSKSPFKIGTAERKILIVFCYYVVLLVMTLISFTISTRNADQVSVELITYFLCERNSLSSSQSCTREGFERLTQPVLTSISYILLGIFPLISLTFVINIQEVKEKMEQCLPKFRHRAPQQSTSVASSSDPPSSTGTAISLLKREKE